MRTFRDIRRSNSVFFAALFLLLLNRKFLPERCAYDSVPNLCRPTLSRKFLCGFVKDKDADT